MYSGFFLIFYNLWLYRLDRMLWMNKWLYGVIYEDKEVVIIGFNYEVYF